MPRLVVRKEGLYYPINFRIWFPNPCKTAKFSNQLNVTGLCHHSVFGAKSAENGQLRKARFFVSDVESGARASKFARFPPKTGSKRSPCSEFRFLPRKACEFQPAELVAACHRFVTTGFLGAKVRKTGPSSAARQPAEDQSRSPTVAEVVRQPAELVTTDVTASVFPCRTASGMPEPPNSLVFGGKRAQFSAFGPEKRRIPARRACHRLSPLRHRFVTGPKSAQKRPSSREDSVLGKFESIMEPGDSSMSHGRARLVQGWLMNAPQVIAAETSVLRRSHETEVSQAF